MIVYKAVRPTAEPNIFLSYTIVEPPFELEYVIGKKTKTAKNTGGIFVFPTLDVAKKFIAGTSAIIECETNEVKPISQICSIWFADFFYDFWKNRHLAFQPNMIKEPPKESYICKDITPVKVVFVTQRQ